ncbi:MAG: hypothetical protein CVU05_03795 [Bacteroidetes bacterium HGW-Bacteroidetes-21]|jgi:hypothetical protein|nr:MAG: hypothetical protein CVU05_03795 [Bacteroidetes bacterium HGW-Bacteroidetes-21]
MKSIFNLIIILSLSTSSFSQKDSLIIFNLKTSADTSVNDVQGLYNLFSSRFVYDTLFHNRQQPASLWIDAEVFLNGKPVLACKSTRSFKNKKGNCGFRTYIRQKDVLVKRNLLPYYALELKEGKYDLAIKITAWKNDTSFSGETAQRIKIYGDSIIKATVNIPPKEYFKVLVSGVRAMETDFEGDPWDYNLISGAPPDICWKVIAGEGDNADFFYSSPVVKNSYSAAWLDDSGEITISKSDKIYVKVYDNDPINDDLMSSLHLSLNELIELSAKNKEIVLGRLSYFKLSAERLRQ